MEQVSKVIKMVLKVIPGRSALRMVLFLGYSCMCLFLFLGRWGGGLFAWLFVVLVFICLFGWCFFHKWMIEDPVIYSRSKMRLY